MCDNMSNKLELRKQIIDYLCGEDDISQRFLKLLAAGGMGKEDGLIIKDRLMEHLNGISDLICGSVSIIFTNIGGVMV